MNNLKSLRQTIVKQKERSRIMEYDCRIFEECTTGGVILNYKPIFWEDNSKEIDFFSIEFDNGMKLEIHFEEGVEDMIKELINKKQYVRINFRLWTYDNDVKESKEVIK